MRTRFVGDGRPTADCGGSTLCRSSLNHNHRLLRGARAMSATGSDAVQISDEHLRVLELGLISGSLEAGEHGQVAVKVIDDRGNELLVIKSLEEVAS